MARRAKKDLEVHHEAVIVPNGLFHVDCERREPGPRTVAHRAKRIEVARRVRRVHIFETGMRIVATGARGDSSRIPVVR
ncbi:MAG: hypothetical protein OET18_17645 [Desulfobacterales bacterium]|nr:hypothetical protein [Desulfobacterales bacterium]